MKKQVEQTVSEPDQTRREWWASGTARVNVPAYDHLLMGVIKQWREGNRLRRRARADPAIRADWIRLYDSVYTEVRRESHLSSTWRSLFENLEDGPPCRQELEWWRAMYMMMLDPRTRVMHTAAAQAIDEMLPDAPDGPSDESYP